VRAGIQNPPRGDPLPIYERKWRREKEEEEEEVNEINVPQHGRKEFSCH